MSLLVKRYHGPVHRQNPRRPCMDMLSSCTPVEQCAASDPPFHGQPGSCSDLIGSGDIDEFAREEVSWPYAPPKPSKFMQELVLQQRAFHALTPESSSCTVHAAISLGVETLMSLLVNRYHGHVHLRIACGSRHSLLFSCTHSELCAASEPTFP